MVGVWVRGVGKKIFLVGGENIGYFFCCGIILVNWVWIDEWGVGCFSVI